MKIGWVAASAALGLMGMAAIGMAQPPTPSAPGGGTPAPSGGPTPGASPPGGTSSGGTSSGGASSGGAPPAGQTASQDVLMRVCNSSPLQAYTAMASRVSVTDQRWVLRGWWSVPAGECINAQRVPKGWVYDFSEAEKTQWNGKDVSLCVQYPGPFERILAQSDQCPPEQLKGFTGVQITDPQMQSYTITLR